MVYPNEWADLTLVPERMWQGADLGLCESQPSHGQALYFMQTPDHRAIALCGPCHWKATECAASKSATT